MADTGAVLPQTASTASESPFSNNDWTTPENIYGAGEASVTAATFDAGDRTYILRGYNFDFSSIPVDSTIDGVVCVVNARYASAIVSIDTCQLLDTLGARVGTDQAATPVDLTTSAANYTFGSSTDNWGNSLTDTWVKNSNFGVAIGMLAGSTGNSNNDVYVDSITLQIYYTVGAQNYTKTITTTEAISDIRARVSNVIRTLTTTEAISDAIAKATGFVKTLTTTEAISDLVSAVKSMAYTALIETTEAISDSIFKLAEFLKALTDTVSIVNYSSPTDNFNRASIGSKWTIISGQPGVPSISGGQLVSTAGCKLYWNDSTYSNDQFVEAKQYGSGWRGISVRESGTTDATCFAYVCWMSTIGGSVNIRLGWHNGAGGYGEYLDSGSTAVGTVTAGDVLRLEVTGQGESIVLKAYINGSLKKTLTKPEFVNQSAIIASGKPGLYFSSPSSIFDDFVGGNIEYPTTEAGFNKPIENTVGLTDILSNAIGFVKTLITTEAISDSVARLSNIIKAISDSLGITDLASAELLGTIYEKLLQTTEAISDSVSTSVGRVVAVLENVGVTDIISKVINYSRNMVESVGITDTANKIINYIRTISLEEAISDSITAFSGLVKLISDNLGITDAVSKIYDSVRIISATEVISDNISKSVDYIRALTTQEGITDLVNGAAGYVIALADSVGITDFVEGIVQSFNNYETTIQDTEEITDSFIKQATYLIIKTDTESISDTVAKLLLLAKLLSDTLGTTDSINRIVTFVRTVSDTGNIVDNINRVIQYIRNIASPISITDIITAVMNYIPPAIPHIHIQGSISKIVSGLSELSREIRLRGQIKKNNN